MKVTLGFDLSKQLHDWAFPDHLLKNRMELMRLCVKTCRELTLHSPQEVDVIKESKLVLKRDKMSRLFYFSDKKYLSLSLPLCMDLNVDNKPRFHYNGHHIDSEMWSKIIERSNCDNYEWMDDEWILSYPTSDDPEFRRFEDLYSHLTNAEYGYVRYDNDPAGYRAAKAQGKEHKHPLHHCDIHLSNDSTFKIGLTGKISENQFIEILDNEQMRWYMNPIQQNEKTIRKSAQEAPRPTVQKK